MNYNNPGNTGIPAVREPIATTMTYGGLSAHDDIDHCGAMAAFVTRAVQSQQRRDAARRADLIGRVHAIARRSDARWDELLVGMR